ncbi:MAG: tRNA uridine-5-carboxymethylaminomethyl(34) synthesis GTPase MnmE [Lachnospiraceae bacterium]|nr:tRNA uridine-5-carboxymethylaminomethyl(34) synthesis GTPase MnmE [Lachnospiraceae bacterium]
MDNDTIAAIATGLSNAGISIIRISGTEAIQIADRLFYAKKENFHLKEAKSHTLHYGILKENQIPLDEVLVSVMRSPNTYTREDVVEINCHGGIIVTKKVLDAVIRCGARLAEPGEFTKRAFLNGRIDLSQAEAVIDIIQAKNNMELENSVRQLNGNINKEIMQLREQILLDMAFIEAALDDPEHISLDGFTEKLEENLSNWKYRLRKLLSTAENGRRIKEGLRTVILGKPNTGKSSLLNMILGENRAIVTDIAGTTRDTLEEYITFNGIPLNIVDTAGIRWTKDVVERIGVDKARQAAVEADLILLVVDSSVALDDGDKEILREVKGKRIIVILNKSDLPVKVTETDMNSVLAQIWSDNGKASSLSMIEVISISAKEATGLEKLEQKITEMFFDGELVFHEDICVTNARHRYALERAEKSLEQVMESIRMGMSEDFYSIDLMDAYRELGTIIGEEVDEDLVNTIFKEFCMGK